MTAGSGSGPIEASVARAIKALLDAQTWIESRDALRTHRELLFSPRAAAVFARLIEENREDQGLSRHLAQRRDLVARAKAEGIDAAYTDLITPQYKQSLLRELGSLARSDSRRLAVLRALLAMTEPGAIDNRLALQAELAANLIYSREGDHGDNIEQALRLLREVEQATPRETSPLDWAGIQNSLAIAHRHRQQGDHANSLEQALAHAKNAAAIAGLPAGDRAMVCNTLANAYADRLLGSREDNLKEAIACFHEALELVPREVSPTEWAMTQNNLGFLYEARGLPGDLAQAVRCYQAAASEYVPDKFPYEAKTLQANLLRVAYREAVESPSDDSEAMLKRYEAALERIASVEGPKEKSELHLRAADIYIQREAGERINNLSAAIHHYSVLLEILTTSGADHLFITKLLIRLADVHEMRAAILDPTEPDSALADRDLAVKLFPQEADPERWARMHHNIGEFYRVRTAGNMSANIERAITHFRQALEVFTADKFPVDCGLAENSLGAAFLMRLEDDPADNIEEAITHLTAALALRPRKKFEIYWAKTKTNLGGAFMRRQRGDPAENAETAIAHFEGAQQVPAFPPVQQAVTACNLAELWMNRKAGGPRENLGKAIHWGEMALRDLNEDTDALCFRAHQLLGDAFRQRSEHDPQDLERAITHYEAATAPRFRDGDLPRWSFCQMHLATLYDKGMGKKAVDDKAKALAHYEAALTGFEAVPIPFMAAMLCGWVAGVLLELGSDKRQLAIAHLRRGIDLFPADGAQFVLADLHKSLADTLYDQQGGDRTATLEEVVAHYRAALRLRASESGTDAVASIRSALAIALLERPGGRRAADLDEAIAHQRAVATIWTRNDHAHGWALAHHNLGNVYVQRILGDPAENIEEGIKCFEVALEIFTKEEFPEDWAMTHNSLGSAYVRRLREERADNIEKAILHYSSALNVYTREMLPDDWAMTMYNMGNAYALRLREGRAANVEAAIHCYEGALEFRTRVRLPFFWAMTKGSLGMAYEQRDYGDRGDNIRRAINHLREAEEVYTPADFPHQWALIRVTLGDAYAADPSGDKAQNLERSIESYQAALAVDTLAANPQLWAFIQVKLALGYAGLAREGDLRKRKLAIDLLQRSLQILTPETDPKHCVYARAHLAQQYALSGDWQAAYDTYEEAIAVSETLLAGAFTSAGRQEEAGSTSDLYAGAAYCLLKLGRPDASFARLDVGKARLLFESLARNDADLSALPSELAEKIRAARMLVRTLETELRANESEIGPTSRSAVPRELPALFPPVDPQTGFAVRKVTFRQAREIFLSQGLSLNFTGLLRKARQELQALVDAAVAEGYYRVPAGLDSDAICAEVPSGGALIALMITPLGSAAFVLPHGVRRIGTEHAVPLADNTHPRAAQLTADWLAAYVEWQWGGPLDAWQRCIDDTGMRLWDLVVGDIHKRLAALQLPEGSSVVLVPHAGMALMPLHAAWRMTESGPRALLDDYTVTCTPSVYALQVSHARLGEPARCGERLLAIINPTGDLPFTETECASVAAQFGTEQKSRLFGEEATEEQVVAAIPGHAYVHFACHGRYDWRNVLRSELTLAAGTRLSLARIISPEVELSALRLIVLSACETGLIEFETAPDESLGLPAGFLEAGAPGVISTLWAVNDLSIALLMEDFYRRHRKNGQAIAAALRAAQRALRNATARELRLAERWKQVYLASGSRDPTAFKLMRHFHARPNVKPFASAYYWAAPIFTGM